MKKTTVGIIVTFTLFLIVFFLYLYALNKKNNPPPAPIIPTTIPLPSSGVSRELEVVATNPKDGSMDIPINTKLTLTFNEPLRNRPIAILIAPEIQFIQKGADKNVIISFLKPLQEGALYTYTIKYPNTNYFPQSFTFTTAGTLQRFLPNTYPGDIE